MKTELKRVIWIIVAILLVFFIVEMALVFFISRSTDARIASNLYKIAHPGKLFQEALNIAVNPSPISTTTTSTVSTSQPVPGSCLILEEQYCNVGKIVKYDKQTYIALSLPVSTVIFAPMDNMIILIIGSPGQPSTKGGDVLRLTTGNIYNKSAGMVLVGAGLLMQQPSVIDNNGNIVTAHPLNKGDVVATLRANDAVPGLGNANTLLRFGSSDGELNTRFASEAKMVQSGQETIEQLIQNMVEAELTK